MKKTPLKKVSTRRKAERNIYIKRKKLFLESNPVCAVCKTFPATQIHHARGRGRYYLDETTWIAVDQECHSAIHGNPRWARDRGYLMDRIGKAGI